jgi:hypothetical protein
MAWLLVVLSIPVLVFLYVLFTPFFLEIDSTSNLWRIRIHHLASARLLVENNSFMVELTITGWKRRIDILDLKRNKEKPEAEKQRKSGKPKITMTKVKSVIRSFKVNACYVNLSFENGLLNAWLFPVFSELRRYSGKQFYINFTDVNEVKIEIENNMARIIWAYFKNKS